MHHNINYENFLVTRPLWAKFDRERYGIPVMWRCKLSMEQLEYSSMLNRRNITSNCDKSNKIIENFAYDFDLETIWRNPFSHIQDLRSSRVVLTPDFSVTSSMCEAQVIANTFKNRWLGCFWQQFYIAVIPTVSWAMPWIYEICLSGILENSPVAISTIGINDKDMFLQGYQYMLNKIKPPYIICYGEIIKGMIGNIITFDFKDAFMPNKHYEQIKLFNTSRLNEIKEVN